MTSIMAMQRLRAVPFALALSLFAAACASSPTTVPAPQPGVARPGADPRIGLRPGMHDAGEAISNLRILSKVQPPAEFVGSMNSDIAFTGNYAIQGNFRGFTVWDISNPRAPTTVKTVVCPASQSDVSVYRNLLFVSGEGLEGRLDCGAQGVQPAASADRLRGIRIFDISDIRNPKYIANVQTCRGSHTHTVLAHPGDAANVYVYVSGSAPPRPATELAGCISAPPSQDPNSALFRIEVIRVPLANPAQAAIVSSPRIFTDLAPPPTHGLAVDDRAELERARAEGKFFIELMGQPIEVPAQLTGPWLDSIMRARGGTGRPSAADSAALRRDINKLVAPFIPPQALERTGPTQCHDITVHPATGLAGGACEGYGMLLDISDPVNPRRIAAAADSNFAYWHSATFNNDGTKVLFSDEWGGGGGARCRASDPKEWGADAIFTIENRQLRFQSYFKLPVAQTPLENCVAHNGSIIPIPGRDVMVQAWYQGGINVFDWTDPRNPTEIAFFDRGPSDANEMGSGGSWSVYWYNGLIVSSEIARGLDILELTPSVHISQNEIDAAKSVRLEYFNAQMQPKFVWPPSFALSRSYVDQLERSQGLSAQRIASVREALRGAESAAAAARSQALNTLASALQSEAASARDAAKVRLLVTSLRDLANAR
jgi:hypothetical protein